MSDAFVTFYMFFVLLSASVIVIEAVRRLVVRHDIQRERRANKRLSEVRRGPNYDSAE